LQAAGISTAIHYPVPIHQQPAYRHYPIPHALAQTERLAQEILTLPLSAQLTDDAAQRVVAALYAVLA
jgi:UDP-2-acetamido-2-deoxy-ribo-hexuluronate aminotransferase